MEDVDETVEKLHADGNELPDQVLGELELGSTGLKQSGGYVLEEFLSQLRGIRGIRTYREMRDNDATIGAVLYSIESMILQAEWNIEVPNEDPTPAQIEVRDFVDGALFKDMEHTWPEMLGDILTFMPYGWAFLEQVYKRRNGENGVPASRFNDGRIGWRKMAIRSQDTLQRWEFDDNGDVRGMWQNNFYAVEAGKAYVFIPIEKALLFTFRSWRGNPEGRSALRNAYRPWYFLKRLQEIEAIGIERELVGLPVIEAPPEVMSQGAGPKEVATRNQLFKIIKNIRANSQAGVVMPSSVKTDGSPSGYKLSLLASGGKRAIDPDVAIQRYKKEIAMTLLAQFLFLDMDSTGSFALAETDTDLFAVSLGATMDRIIEKMNREAIPRLMRLNGIPQELWPVMTHGDIESRDIMVLANYVSTLLMSGAISSDGLEEKLREAGGLPPRELSEGEPPVSAPPATEPDPGAMGEEAIPPETIQQQAPADRLFKTGLGGAKPHTHTFRTGDERTSLDQDHDHELTPGATDTGPGGPDKHTHTVPRFAQGGA